MDYFAGLDVSVKDTSVCIVEIQMQAAISKLIIAGLSRYQLH